MATSSNRKPLFSQTKKDFVVTPCRGSGPGGQHRNKSYTGCQIKHPASGAYAEATDNRSFDINKRNAFNKLVNSIKFKIWWNAKVLEIEHGEEIEREVARQMEQVRVDYKVDGKWIEVE